MKPKKKKFYETAEFQKIHNKWAKILADPEVGDFEDIEAGETYVRPQVFVSEWFKVQYKGGLNYYQLCQEILRVHAFKKEIHKTIFEFHSEGKTTRQIEKWIKKNTLFKLDQSSIVRIINRTVERYTKGQNG